MPLSTLMPIDVALFSKMVTSAEEYEAMTVEEKKEIEDALNSAVSYVLSYTGLQTLDGASDDLLYATKAVATEMLDNRQMTTQYVTQNPTAIQILNMHSTNLLPSE